MKKLLIAAFILGISVCAEAQYRSGSRSASDKIYFGGGFGLNIGTDVTNISVSPLVGYRFTDQFSSGVSFSYQYVKYRGVDESFGSTGGSLFSRFLFNEEFFAHAEYEILGYDQVLINTGTGDFTSTRELNNSFFVGAGYRQNAGRNASFFVLGLYDLLWKNANESAYAVPYQVRAGFAVGF